MGPSVPFDQGPMSRLTETLGCHKEESQAKPTNHWNPNTSLCCQPPPVHNLLARWATNHRKGRALWALALCVLLTSFLAVPRGDGINSNLDATVIAADNGNTVHNQLEPRGSISLLQDGCFTGIQMPCPKLSTICRGKVSGLWFWKHSVTLSFTGQESPHSRLRTKI